MHRRLALTRNVLIMEKAGYALPGRGDCRTARRHPQPHPPAAAAPAAVRALGTLALALSSHAIFPVDASTIEDYAYLCAADGAASAAAAGGRALARA